MRLKDKVALITGGAGGIGQATAKLFINEGARVVLVDQDEAALEKVLQNLGEDKLSTCFADVSKVEDTKKFVKHAMDAYGKIDIFFANAGIEGVSSVLAEYPETLFDKIIAINLKGVWLGCREVIPKMEDGGSVMITSSVAGLKGFKGLGPYVASKHAVVGLMRVAALENAERGIRVNTIHPGPVNNEMMRRLEKNMSPTDPDGVLKGFEAVVPFGRYAENSEIADTALFLASDESRYITGRTHVVDGGMMIN